MKKVTAAVVLINPKGDILACHATGQPEGRGYDFPKGMVEDGETHKDAAVRELMEETGINLSSDYLSDLGIYKHNKEKNIHIFAHKVNEFPALGTLRCSTYFEANGRSFPEVNWYKVISKEERGLFNKVLQNKFEIIDKFNEE